jgi:phospholipase A1
MWTITKNAAAREQYPKTALTSFLVLGTLLIPGISLGNDVQTCMADRMQTVDDSVTIGELRLQCQKQLHTSDYVPEDRPDAVISQRLRKDRENVLEPFTLMAHKPNYILLATHNFSGYDPAPYREQVDDESFEIDRTEAQFEISIKAPLAINLFDTFDVYTAYTNRSFWQVYNDDVSKPFRETNHEPEIWIQFNPEWEFKGLTNTANSFGVVHQSNGRSGVLSRSWNRLYASFAFEKENLALAFKPWYRFKEDKDKDDNPDITDYLGHYELRGAYRLGEHVFSAMSRNNVESGFSRGAVELAWSFPLWEYPYMKGYIQYFNGYGESMIDYNQHVNRIGIGLALSDWL